MSTFPTSYQEDETLRPRFMPASAFFGVSSASELFDPGSEGQTAICVKYCVNEPHETCGSYPTESADGLRAAIFADDRTDDDWTRVFDPVKRVLRGSMPSSNVSLKDRVQSAQAIEMTALMYTHATKLLRRLERSDTTEAPRYTALTEWQRETRQLQDQLHALYGQQQNEEDDSSVDTIVDRFAEHCFTFVRECKADGERHVLKMRSQREQKTREEEGSGEVSLSPSASTSTEPRPNVGVESSSELELCNQVRLPLKAEKDEDRIIMLNSLRENRGRMQRARELGAEQSWL